MVRIKMKATGGPFMWKKLGLPRPSPSDSDDEAWDTPPPVTTSTETPPATGTTTGHPISPNVQAYHRRNKAPRIAQPYTSPTVLTAIPKGKTPPEATTSTNHGQKRPRTPSPTPSPHPKQETETTTATHPAGHEASDVPSDTPSSVPSDTPSDVPSDTPSDMPSDLPIDLPKPSCPDHITQALTFNKAS
ncbi:putative uncharacterized protein DDB_G0290521 [Manihot esculenta]|uniref:putative uncharacterized protein DDB_G0290521 n=1 Tax=Manihot esculenta TaxID=3983 RepID=UPI000B5D7399|nr:putative uncharacterized protein DDB_G0290521 [Manihot esculenta]